MSNGNFDLLWKQTELMRAKDSLKAYTEASNRTDLTETDREFLTRAVKCAQDWVARAKADLRNLAA
jgi:hypothetical protein